MIDHDRLFKELLSTFFLEFVDLFLPQVSAYLDRDSLVFLHKEVFTDVTSGGRHEADRTLRRDFMARSPSFSFTSSISHIVKVNSGSGSFATSQGCTRSMGCPSIRW